MVLPLTKPQNYQRNLRLFTLSNPYFTQKTTTSAVGNCIFVRISGKFDYPNIYTDPDGLSGQRADSGNGKTKGVDINLFSNNDPKNLDKYAEKVKRPTDTFVVGGHGFANGIQGPNGTMTAQDLASEIKKDSNYTGQSVTLFSCNTGSLDNGFAQQLADELNTTVFAPDNLLWYYSDGRKPVIAPYKNPEYPNNSPPDMDKQKQGQMRKFVPTPKPVEETQ
jgi:hypothetical protein